MKGKRVKNPQRLLELCKMKKCVFIVRTGGGNRFPAAFFASMQFRYVMYLINNKQVHEYKKREVKNGRKSIENNKSG